jgi:hypothetical protein
MVLVLRETFLTQDERLHTRLSIEGQSCTDQIYMRHKEAHAFGGGGFLMFHACTPGLRVRR